MRAKVAARVRAGPAAPELKSLRANVQKRVAAAAAGGVGDSQGSLLNVIGPRGAGRVAVWTAGPGPGGRMIWDEQFRRRKTIEADEGEGETATDVTESSLEARNCSHKP